MDPSPSSRQQQYRRRVVDALPRYISEFNQQPPTCFLDFSDDGDRSDERIRQLCDQIRRRRTATGMRSLLVTYFLLGRILSSLDRESVYPTLRKQMTYARAQHVSRGALRAFEVFSISGPEFIVISSLSPPVLSEMSATGYSAFIDALQAQALLARLTEQTPLEGNSVTVHGDTAELHP